MRRGLPADAEALAAFAALTFQQTFGHSTSPEHMAEHLATAYGPDLQRRELEDPDWVTLIVEHEGALAAFAQVRRREPPEAVAERDAIELHRFYVASFLHGRGVAQELMRAARQAARGLGGRSMWLGVWEENARAIAFYTKAGFRDVGAWTFWVGADPQTDRIMLGPASEE